jgi:hypothetical protein
MLSNTIKSMMLSVNTESVVMINVVAPQKLAANVSEYNRNGKI